MSLSAWNKRVHCKHSWAVYSLSTDIVSEILDRDIIEIPVMYGKPFRVAELKKKNDMLNRESVGDSYILINNTIPTCALCDPGLFSCDLVFEELKLDTIDRHICILGIPRDSRLTSSDVQKLKDHFAPYQLDLNENEFEDSIQSLERCVKQESDLARITYEFLSCHPKIRFISYVGSKTHDDYQLASTTLRGGFSGYIDFALCNTQPKSLLSFLDYISGAGLDVEFLSVDQEDIEVSTLIRLKCSNFNAFEQLNILEKALAMIHS